MARRIFFTLGITLLVSLTSAQSTTQDVVYLKNGSIIKGKIIDQQASDRLKIELAGGSIFVFDVAGIDSIRKENILKSKLKEIRNNYFRKDRGFRNMTELAIIYGINFKNGSTITDYYYNTNQDDIGLSLQTINGYQFWPYLYVGAGVGIDRFITYQQTFSPFFLRLSSEFLKRKVTPYIYADGGYSIMWKQPENDNTTATKNTGGVYVAAGGGVRIYTRSRASVILSAGYKMNMSSSTWSNIYDTYDVYNNSRTYQRFVMNIGVSF